MENYEEKFELNDLVTGKRTYNGEIIEGEFQGFHLVDKFNSDSIVGVISVKKDRCYDVFPHSIKFVESEDERTRKDIINYIEQKQFGSEPYYEDDAAEKDYSPLWNNRIYLTLKSLYEQLKKL